MGTVSGIVQEFQFATDADVHAALALAAADIESERAVDEGGAGLSAGQRQRIGLARAFLRAQRGATLLPLDEPTAHVDGATEDRILAGLRTLTPGRYVVLATHRPALVTAADVVVRISEARLVSDVDTVQDLPLRVLHPAVVAAALGTLSGLRPAPR